MKKLISLVISGLFLGMTTAMIGNLLLRPKAITSQTSSDHRFPSSTTVNQSILQWQGKHQRLLEASISPVGGIPNNDEKDLVLKAHIRGLQPLMGEVYYNWILPPGASVVAGELSDSIASLPDPEKFLETEITVQGISHEEGGPKIVILQVYTLIDGVKIGNSAVFSTESESVQLSPSSQEKEGSLTAHPLPANIQQ